MTISDLEFIPEEITASAAQRFSDKYLDGAATAYADKFIEVMIRCLNDDDDDEFNDLDNNAYMVRRFRSNYDCSHDEVRADTVFDLLVDWRANYIGVINEVKAGIV